MPLETSRSSGTVSALQRLDDRDMIGKGFVEASAALVGERDHAQPVIHLHQAAHFLG